MKYITIAKFLILCLSLSFKVGANDLQQKYCEITKKITPEMPILTVFNLLGVPANFSLPKNINIEKIRGKNFNTVPTNDLTQEHPDLSNHPIFGAFNNLPDDENNTLTWVFESGTIIITVQLHGSKVFSVNDNLGCKA